jgi:hypothetical protein
MSSGQLALFLGAETVAQAKSPGASAARGRAPVAPIARSPAEDGVLLRLRGLDCDNLSPRAALDLLAELATRVRSA